MDPETRSELDRLALELLRQDASNAAFQLAVIDALGFNDEHLEAFLLRFANHHRIQMMALIERIRLRHPRYAEELESKIRGP